MNLDKPLVELWMQIRRVCIRLCTMALAKACRYKYGRVAGWCRHLLGDVLLEEVFDDLLVHPHALHRLLVHIRALPTETDHSQPKSTVHTHPEASEKLPTCMRRWST